MRITKKTVITGLSVLVVFLCAIGFLFAPNDPGKVDLSLRLLGPSADYPFGTDAMGRCVLSRVLYGGKTTLGIVLFSAALILITGTVVGLLAGYGRAKESAFLESLLNAVTALPPIAYLIVFMGAWGSGVSTMMVALTLSLFLRVVKLMKAKTEIESNKAYVLCAVASGASKPRILFMHIMPNVIKDSIVFISLSCADMILMMTSFSFIGVGLGDNAIDWGGMVLESRAVSMMRPDLILYPILFIFFCTLSFNALSRELE